MSEGTTCKICGCKDATFTVYKGEQTIDVCERCLRNNSKLIMRVAWRKEKRNDK